MSVRVPQNVLPFSCSPFGIFFGLMSEMAILKNGIIQIILYWLLTLMKKLHKKKVLILNIAADFRYLIFLSQ